MEADRRKCTQAPLSAPTSMWARLGRWLNAPAPEDRYLSAAADHADLERRVRNLEHASRGPALVTFNH